ncbi:hypothetical protein K488DRAFT_74224 [Vararia minispora EC-137]|uniref:Uncharacterized protein n=1 Tax=Vararia minispora EC-137 TaxID=1314806 RepID=A0ACB8Q802_9AGAM|nr:hypothetical protein K488DRAFT_74224 [Vararia minispora EC-137]
MFCPLSLATGQGNNTHFATGSGTTVVEKSWATGSDEEEWLNVEEGIVADESEGSKREKPAVPSPGGTRCTFLEAGALESTWSNGRSLRKSDAIGAPWTAVNQVSPAKGGKDRIQGGMRRWKVDLVVVWASARRCKSEDRYIFLLHKTSLPQVNTGKRRRLVLVQVQDEQHGVGCSGQDDGKDTARPQRDLQRDTL